jgi:hypothetical protein
MRKNVFMLGILLGPHRRCSPCRPAAQDEMALPDFIERTDCEVDLTGQTQIPIYHFGDLSASLTRFDHPAAAGRARPTPLDLLQRGVAALCGAEFVSEAGHTSPRHRRRAAIEVTGRL